MCSYLGFCSGCSSFCSFCTDDDGAKFSSSDGSLDIEGAIESPWSMLSLLLFFWKRREMDFLNFCKTLSVEEADKSKQTWSLNCSWNYIWSILSLKFCEGCVWRSSVLLLIFYIYILYRKGKVLNISLSMILFSKQVYSLSSLKKYL